MKIVIQGAKSVLLFWSGSHHLPNLEQEKIFFPRSDCQGLKGLFPIAQRTVLFVGPSEYILTNCFPVFAVAGHSQYLYLPWFYLWHFTVHCNCVRKLCMILGIFWVNIFLWGKGLDLIAQKAPSSCIVLLCPCCGYVFPSRYKEKLSFLKNLHLRGGISPAGSAEYRLNYFLFSFRG